MAVAASYRVKLDAFDGPLDLLLHLVRTNEVDIYHLPIATITDQYLAYLDMLDELNLNIAGEYLVMAASLMYMKSRLLLPVDESEDEEEEDGVGDLVRQLADYQRYKEAAEALRDRVILDRDVFARSPTPPEDGMREPPGVRRVELADLLAALRIVLERAVARTPHTVDADEVSVADAVRAMIDRLRTAGSVVFAQLFSPEATRAAIIATFVGLLELIKLGSIRVEQQQILGPIEVCLLDEDVDATLALLEKTYGRGIDETVGDEDEHGVLTG